MDYGNTKNGRWERTSGFKELYSDMPVNDFVFNIPCILDTANYKIRKNEKR